MAAPTDTFIDPADGAAAGNDHGGNAFVDGTFANATNTLTKIGAFLAANTQAGDKIYLDDNGSGEVTAGLYTISARTDDDNIVMTADIRSGAPDPTDVRCDQHTGVVGLPWATVQHANDFTTRDAANGDRMNVKAGTDDVLAASLDFTTYGVPTTDAPWILQGYTNAAADGGVGGVDGNGGNFSIIGGGTLDYLYFIDAHLHNTGAADIMDVDDSCHFVRCEIDESSLLGIDMDNYGSIWNCNIHNCIGVLVELAALVAFNTFTSGTTLFANAITLKSNGGMAFYNVIDGVATGGTGIRMRADSQVTMFNSIYQTSAGTGEGIDVEAGAEGVVILNNIIEGFSGIGGVAIRSDAGAKLLMLGYNAFYNNTASYANAGDILLDLTANDLDPLAASAFTNAGADDFTVTTEVRALAYPTANYPSLAVRSFLDMGALQREEAGGAAVPVFSPSTIIR